MTTEQWKCEQAKDEAIGEVIKVITLGADTHSFTSKQAKQMYRFRSKFVMRHGLLDKKYYDINSRRKECNSSHPRNIGKRLWKPVTIM